jgi:hypothetical protein
MDRFVAALLANEHPLFVIAKELERLRPSTAHSPMACHARPASFAMTNLSRFIAATAPVPPALSSRHDKTWSGWATGWSGFTREG